MSEKRQRDIRVTIRLNEAEATELNNRAENQSLTLAGYFRTAVLNTPPPPQSRRPPVDKKILGQLLGKIGSIGNNINQLARVANEGSWPESQQLKSACDDIQEIRHTLMLALGTDPKIKPRSGP